MLLYKLRRATFEYEMGRDKRKAFLEVCVVNHNCNLATSLEIEKGKIQAENYSNATQTIYKNNNNSGKDIAPTSTPCTYFPVKRLYKPCVQSFKILMLMCLKRYFFICETSIKVERKQT